MAGWPSLFHVWPHIQCYQKNSLIILFRSKDRLKDNWQFYFLSPQMEVFKSNKTVLDNIAKDTNYTQVNEIIKYAT